MDRKSIVLLLSFAVTAGFLFPVFYWNSFEMSGLNFILSAHTPSYKYFLLVIPLVSVFIFLETYYNENFVSTRRLISWAPLLALILVFTLSSVQDGFGNVLSQLGVGFWTILIFSTLLALVLYKRKERRKELSTTIYSNRF